MTLRQFFETDTITGKYIVQHENPTKSYGFDVIHLYVDNKVGFTEDIKILFHHNVPDWMKEKKITDIHCYRDGITILVIEE